MKKEKSKKIVTEYMNERCCTAYYYDQIEIDSSAYNYLAYSTYM